MKKWIAVSVICSMLLGVNAIPVWAETAVGNNNILLVDGRGVEVYPYNIGGSNYFKVRDMAVVMANTASSFDVGWNENTQSVELRSGAPYSGAEQVTYPKGESTAEAIALEVPVLSDGNIRHMAAYNIEGSNYFRIRDLAEMLDAEINWNESTQMMEWISSPEKKTDSVQDDSISAVNSAEQSSDGLREVLKIDTLQNTEQIGPMQDTAILTSRSEGIRRELTEAEIEEIPAMTLSPQKEDPTEIITDVKLLMNSAVLHPKLTKFGVLNDVITDFMAQNFTEDMDPYTKATVAYDYFIRNMTYGTAKDLDMSKFTKAEAGVIWQCYPERYILPIMQNHVGVCNHYSCAYGAILRAIGYNVEIVSGQTYAAGGRYSNHVWVEVVIGGNHYVFDPQVEQNIAKRYGGVIQYNRFGKPMVNMGGNYKDGKHYVFSEE